MNHKLQTILDKMTNVPLSEWDEMVYQLNTSERVEIAEHLDDRIQMYSLLVEYLERRGAAGCGDSGHDEAMKQSTKRLKKVRNALGYTYP